MTHSWVKRPFSFFFSSKSEVVFLFLFLQGTLALWQKDGLRRDNCGEGWKVSGEKWGKSCFFVYFFIFIIIILTIILFVSFFLYCWAITSNLMQTRKSSMSCYIVLKLRSYHVYVCLDYQTPTVGLLIEYFFKY